MIHDFPWDYVIHFGLEALGGLVGIYAYNFCRHTWHRLTIWFVLTALTTVITVQVVG